MTVDLNAIRAWISVLNLRWEIMVTALSFRSAQRRNVPSLVIARMTRVSSQISFTSIMFVICSDSICVKWIQANSTLERVQSHTPAA